MKPPAPAISPSSGAPVTDHEGLAAPLSIDPAGSPNTPTWTGHPTRTPTPAEISRSSGRKSGRPGGAAQVLAGREAKEERVREHHRLVQQMADEWLADLPVELRGRVLVRQSLLNMARSQLALDAHLDRVVRGERIPIGEQESMRKLASDAQAFKTDLLSRWPRAEDHGAEKPPPKSVLGWLSGLDEGVPRCPTCNQAVHPTAGGTTEHERGGEVLTRDDLPIIEPKPKPLPKSPEAPDLQPSKKETAP
jgi:hypothetical protein